MTISKNLIEEFLGGSSKPYENVSAQVKKFLNSTVSGKTVYSKLENSWKDKKAPDFVDTILAQLWESFKKEKTSSNWSSYSDNDISKIFFRKVKDFIGQVEQTECRVNGISTRLIGNLDWQKGQKGQYDLRNVKRLYYLIFDKRKRTSSFKNSVSFDLKNTKKGWQIIFQASNSNFAHYLVSGENSVKCKVFQSKNGPKNYASPQVNCIRVLQMSNPRMRAKIPHSLFSLDSCGQLVLEEEKIPPKYKKEGEKLYSILSNREATFQICTTTGFHLLSKGEEYFLSLEDFAAQFTHENLFTDKFPGSFLATIAYLKKEVEYKEDFDCTITSKENLPEKDIQKMREYAEEMQNFMEIFGIDGKKIIAEIFKLKLPKKVKPQRDSHKDKDAILMIIHGIEKNIDESVLEAFSSTYCKILHSCHSFEKNDWQSLACIQKRKIFEFIEQVGDKDTQIALFGINYIPLAIHLGHLLGSRNSVKLHEYNRYKKTWKWEKDEGALNKIFTTGVPKKKSNGYSSIVLRLSISAEVKTTQIEDIVGEKHKDIHIYLENPEIGKFNPNKLLESYSESLKKVFQSIREHCSEVNKIHIFAAIPNSAAVELGRHLQLTRYPQILTYNFDNQKGTYSLAFIFSTKKSYCSPYLPD